MDEQKYEVGQQVKVAYMQDSSLGFNRKGEIVKVRPFGEYSVKLTDGSNAGHVIETVDEEDIAPQK